MVEPTKVPIEVEEKGADEAARALDRVQWKLQNLTEIAPMINRLAGGLTGLGQVARLLGDEFDQLGQQITQLGFAAQGLGALGAIFGPLGQAIGTGIGLLVGSIQAAPQIQEMTLSFIPKLMVLVIVLVMVGPWMLGLIMDFTINLIESIPELIG